MGQPFKDEGIRDSVVNIERHRWRLEENALKLQNSLRYWQTCEAEYESLKEEISGLGDDPTHAQLKKAGDEFGGELLNQKEIKLLFEDPQGHWRSRQQIVGLLDRRLEYVQSNIKSVQSLLEDAERKAAASVVIGQEVCNDEGLPLTEIREDLDEEGNVISSSITSPGDAAPRVLEALRKAGVDGLPESKIDKKDGASIARNDAVPTKPRDLKGPGLNVPSEGVINHIESVVPSADTTASVRRKKSVSFAEGTKEGDSTTDKSRNIFGGGQKLTMTYLRKLLGPGTPLATKIGEELKSSSSRNTKIPPQQKVKEPNKKNGKILSLAPDPNFALSKDSITAPNTELKIQGDKSKKEPFSAIIPSDETAEDAALRRQMIQYNMEDVGAIVAEIDLDEGDSGVWTDEDDSDAWTDEDEVNDSSAEEEEDQYGRTKRRVVSDKYRQEMLALEEKLNAQSVKNVGPEKNIIALPRKDIENQIEGGRLTDGDERSPARKTSPTKEVRFATEVQIQDAACDKEVLAALTDTQINSPQDCPPAKKATISRFKAERTSSTSSTTPKPPDGIFASSILERPYNQKVLTSSPAPTRTLNAIASDMIVERPYEPALPSSPAPPSSDDPALVQQQLAAEYHRLRNRMIYRQGGFLADDDEEEEETVVDVNVDRNGGKAEPSHQEDASRLEQQASKKISRFRAARLKGIGGAIR